MVQLTLTSDDEQGLFRDSKRLSDRIKEKLEGEYGRLPFMVFGPFEAQIYKLNEKYRMRMVVKCKLSHASRKLFHELLCEFSGSKDSILSIDLNPLTV